ncbi:MAG TPA: DeoR/GlpR family DNA-binding transcription regulator [Kiloniellales bacterium]|nr:DeoR/GlpR family DNA-binding transcription regulator [Kiloniellales bacterium]
MTLSDRQNAIVELIRQEGYQAIEALAEHFGVTPQTIRRDVNLLCEARLLRRLHGGAELLSGAENLPYDTRRITHLESKRRIAERVRALVPNHSSLFIGIGTTLEQVALALADHDDLLVVTNNLNAAMAFSANRSHRIMIAGGKLRLPDRDLLGEDVEALFAGYKVDYGIFGVGGIDEDGTLLDFDPAEVRAREALMANCRLRVLVADATKFGRNATVRGGSITDVDCFITDAPPPKAIAGRLASARIKVEVVQTPEGERVHVA